MAEETETAVITATGRGNYGGIIADVVIRETHVDEIEITEHPVEKGAPIADHMYKLPARVTILAGWTNSGPQSNGDEGYILEIYDKLLALQVSGNTIDVTTGKRVLTDMLIKSLKNDTTSETEHSLPIQMELQQVIIAESSTVTVPTAEHQASPEKTTPVIDSGPKQPIPAPGFTSTNE